MTLKITNLQKQFNNRLAVDIPHLTIDSGECFGLVGENGAGKTTLLRAMLDLVDVDRGGIQIENNDVSKTSDWKANTSSFLGESFLIDFLTPYEFFLFVGSAYGISKANVDSWLNDYQDFLANDDFYDETKLIRDLSSGVVQKVGLMSALLVKPRLLILDEPFTHLDPKAQLQFKNILNLIKNV